MLKRFLGIFLIVFSLTGCGQMPAGQPINQSGILFVHPNAKVEMPSWISTLSTSTVNSATLKSGPSGLRPVDYSTQSDEGITFISRIIGDLQHAKPIAGDNYYLQNESWWVTLTLNNGQSIKIKPIFYNNPCGPCNHALDSWEATFDGRTVYLQGSGDYNIWGNLNAPNVNWDEHNLQIGAMKINVPAPRGWRQANVQIGQLTGMEWVNPRDTSERMLFVGTNNVAAMKNTSNDWDVTVLVGRQNEIQWTDLPSIRADGYFTDSFHQDPFTGAKLPYTASGWAHIWEDPHSTGFYVEVFAPTNLAQNLSNYLSQTVKFSYK